jgi:hypothetical protein
MKPEASMCAWCGKVLQPKTTALIVKAQTAISVPECEGVFVPFKLVKSSRTITGFFVTSNSPTKRQGIDVIFATCSPECASALKAAVQEEVDNLGLIIS